MPDDHFDPDDLSLADPAARLRRHVQERLHVLEKTGQCPVCYSNQWALLTGSDMGGSGATTQLPGWPTYALACGHCGLVRHHLRSIFDGSDALPPSPSSPGPGSRLSGAGPASFHDAPVEAKLAVLEKIAATTEDLLAELRWDLKAVRSRQEEDHRSLADRMADHAANLSGKIDGSTLRLYAAGAVGVFCVLIVLAKALRWF